MSNWPGIDPVLPLWLIATLTLTLISACVYWEVSRAQKFLAARILALTLLTIALLGILLKPYFLSDESSAPAMLLTENFKTQQADSIIAANPSLKLFSTTAAPYPGTTEIHVNEVGSIENLRFILGDGLPADALLLVNDSGLDFFPSSAPEGVIQIALPNTIRPHELSIVRGVANVEEESLIKLTGPGGVDDSARVRPGNGEFTLRFRPRLPGLFLYSLTLKNKSLEKTESLPIEVQAEKKLKILFLQKFPTAESRALKNYLSENDHAVALRYQVSKTNFNYEYSNLPPQPLNKLTPKFLASFDLLFMDDYLFDEMSTFEKSTIGQSIRSGLGVILFVEKISGRESTINSILPFKAKKAQNDTVHLSINKQFITLPAMPIEIMPNPDVQPVLQTANRVLSGYFYSGSGKIGFQFLRETYRVRVEGKMDEYASIWQGFIERIARAKPSRFKIMLNNAFPYTVNESVPVDVLSDGSQPTLFADNIIVPMKEDVLLDDVWHGTTWATTPGWHSFKVQHDSTSALNYFVSDLNAWKPLRQMRQRHANELFSRKASTQQPSVVIRKPINNLVWYILFLLSAGFLWLAPKL